MNSLAPSVTLPEGPPADPWGPPPTPHSQLSRRVLSAEFTLRRKLWLTCVPVCPPRLIPEETWGSWREHKLDNKFLKILNKPEKPNLRKRRPEENLRENQASGTSWLSTCWGQTCGNVYRLI